MQASHAHYDFGESLERIDEILAGADASYQDHKGIPARERLTYTNGFYVDITVMFIDIRGSKQLAEKHTRPVLAKIYRAYISEVVAVLKDCTTINEIYIEGDGVWAVFNTSTTVDVQDVVNTAGKVAALIEVLNSKLTKRSYSKIKIGIGIEDGDSLYIKAGFKGSAISEVVWIGRSIGEAAKLCGFGSQGLFDQITMISTQVYKSLSDEQKVLFSWNPFRECYNASIVNIAMYDWAQNNG